ncbi:MAG: hydrogenase nickel incorporation protein HypB [Bacilli bacterium]|nr:hydrogenase nickel incorporation protein HypB [Bacilli bacterium]MDY6392002.1 hydrogenase nickel incorporation protein HypB [Bacilli bacterium]
MGELKVIKVKQSVLANNDLRAERLRGELKEKGVFFLNVMSSPGSGKTTLLIELINRLKKHVNVGVIEADMDADVDAHTVEKATGVRTIQLNTSGECHLDAKMTSEGIAALGTDNIDLVILENIGNLVCPAEFDTGATMNMVLLSVPEGDDKPLKYPLMFTRGDIFVFTKMDATVVFDFDLEKAESRILKLNPKAQFFPVSAKKGDGIDALVDFLLSQVKNA